MKKAVLIGTLALIAGSANAAVDIFIDEGNFLNEVGDFYLEDFDGYVYGGYTDLTLDLGPVNGFSYTLDADLGDGDPGLWSGDGNMSTNSALNMLRATFTGDPVYAVGGYFFASDINGFYIPGMVTIGLSDGTTYDFSPGSDIEFRGFVSDVPIDYITIDAEDDLNTPVYRWSTMDHFYVGNAVPAPGSALLLGFAGVAGLRRRR